MYKTDCVHSKRETPVRARRMIYVSFFDVVADGKESPSPDQALCSIESIE